MEMFKLIPSFSLGILLFRPLKELQYFRDIEMVLEQSGESKMKWLNFFED